MLRIVAAVILSSVLFSSGASGCRQKQTSTPNEITDRNNSGAPKVLAEGPHSSITNPFIAVIRDAETYAALLKLESSLPKLDSDFFKSKAVIAAFLGQRNTGGYGVAIIPDEAGRILVSEKAPGKGVMVPQIITSPFKVISVSTGEATPIVLAADQTFQQRAQNYKVTSGNFKIVGGFAGRGDQFRLAGDLQTTREANLVTVAFALKSTGASKARLLEDFATGLVEDNRLTINRLSDGGLVDTPSAGLRAEGEFLPQNKLSLRLIGMPIMVPDGYTGQGSIEAQMVNASAN